MAKKLEYKAMYNTGRSYKGNDGKDHNVYLQVGVVLMDEETGNLSMKLEAVPVNPKRKVNPKNPSAVEEGGIWISFFRPDPPKDSSQAPQAKAASGDPNQDEDVPF